jgi:hypothetical protein
MSAALCSCQHILGEIKCIFCKDIVSPWIEGDSEQGAEENMWT